MRNDPDPRNSPGDHAETVAAHLPKSSLRGDPSALAALKDAAAYRQAIAAAGQSGALFRCCKCGTLSRLSVGSPRSRIVTKCSPCAKFTNHELAGFLAMGAQAWRRAYTANPKPRRRWRHFLACLAWPARWIPRAWADWRRGYTMAERDSMLKKYAAACQNASGRLAGNVPFTDSLTRAEFRAWLAELATDPDGIVC